MRVLLVDDSLAKKDLIESLCGSSIEITHIQDVETALAVLEEAPFDCVVTGFYFWQTSPLTGARLIQILRREECELPILVLSSAAFDEPSLGLLRRAGYEFDQAHLSEYGRIRSLLAAYGERQTVPTFGSTRRILSEKSGTVAPSW